MYTQLTVKFTHKFTLYQEVRLDNDPIKTKCIVTGITLQQGTITEDDIGRNKVFYNLKVCGSDKVFKHIVEKNISMY